MSKELIDELRQKYPEIPYHRDELHKQAADTIECLESEVERLTPLQYRQAPCRNQCEAQAFRIDERNLTSALAVMTQSRDAYQRAADDMAAAHKVERDALALDAARYRRMVDLHEIDEPVVHKCVCCGTTENLFRDGWYGYRCRSTDCMVF